ncbi:WG repeat-containing protein [Micromonospora endolithica]|uniref:WG repeat-containing protein n=1 Tax=Micromonospora endolithica TaxID=230091 RepID=A0A3A9ZUX2_9ACTN|nr:hypothetical protein D7223_03760 [Micromonospora endolithica]TWJ20358.1 WG repeat protein [Micromonospora endolithica]
MSRGYADRWHDPAEPSWVVEPTNEWHPQFPGQRYPGDIGTPHAPPPRSRATAVGRAEVPPLAPTRPDGTYLGRSWDDEPDGRPRPDLPTGRHDGHPTRADSHPSRDDGAARRGYPDEMYRRPAGDSARSDDHYRRPEPDARNGRGATDRSTPGRPVDEQRHRDNGRDRQDHRAPRHQPAASDRPVSPTGYAAAGWVPEPDEGRPRRADSYGRPADGPARHEPVEEPRRPRYPWGRAAEEHRDRAPDPPWDRPGDGRWERTSDGHPDQGPDDARDRTPDDRWHRTSDAFRDPSAPGPGRTSQGPWAPPADRQRPTGGHHHRTDAPGVPVDRRSWPERDRPAQPPHEGDRRRTDPDEYRRPREAAARAETYPDRRPRPPEQPRDPREGGLPWPPPGPVRPYDGDTARRPEHRRPVEPVDRPRHQTPPQRYDERPRGPVTREPATPVSPAPLSGTPVSPAPVSGPPVVPDRPVSPATPAPVSGPPVHDRLRPPPPGADDQLTDGRRDPARPAPADEPVSGPPAARLRVEFRPAPTEGTPTADPAPTDARHGASTAPTAESPAAPAPTGPGLPRPYVPPPSSEPTPPPPVTTPPGSADAWFRPARPTGADEEPETVRPEEHPPAPDATGPPPADSGRTPEAAAPVSAPPSDPSWSADPVSGPPAAPVSAPPAVPVSAAPAEASAAPPAYPPPMPITDSTPGAPSTPPAYPTSAPPEHPESTPPAAPVSAAPAEATSAPPDHPPPMPTTDSTPAALDTPVSAPPAYPTSAPPEHPESTPPAAPIPAPPAAPTSAPPAAPISAPPAHPTSTPPDRPVSAPPLAAAPTHTLTDPPAEEAPTDEDAAHASADRPGSTPPDAGPRHTAVPNEHRNADAPRPVSAPPSLTAAPAPRDLALSVDTSADESHVPATESARSPERAGRPDPVRDDPEQVLAGYPWRLDPTTLREVVEEPEDFRVVRRRLTEKLGSAVDNRSRARLLSLRAVVSRIVGDLDDALADGRLALTYAEATGELRRTSLAQARLAHVLRWRGEYAEADRLFAHANSDELPDRLRAALHEHAGRCCFDQGRLIEACDHFERALDLRGAADPELLARVRSSLDAVADRATAGGFGPYPRGRDEVLERVRPPVPARDGDRWGYADADGEMVVPGRYAEVQPFHDGVAWVRPPDGDRWALIDLVGETVVAPTYRVVRSFSDGLAWVSHGEPGGWCAVDTTGEIAVPPGFADVRPFRRGLAAVRREGWGAVDRTGRIVVSTRYHGFATTLSDGRYVDGFTDEGLAVIDVAGRRGVVDRTGTVLVPPVHPVLVVHPVAFLTGDGAGRWGALDRRGEPLIDPVHRNPDDVVAEIDRLLTDTNPVL